MTGTSADGSVGGRIASTLGPESVATILSVAVVLAIASFVFRPGSQPLGGATDGTPEPGASAAAAPTAPAASDPAAGSAEPSPASWAPLARTMNQSDLALIGLREDLVDELESEPKQADDLARLLRAVNSNIDFGLRTVNQLKSAGLPPDLVDELDTIHRDAREASLQTLTASLSNVNAYRDGAQAVVDELKGLDEVVIAVAEASGLPPPDIQAPAETAETD